MGVVLGSNVFNLAAMIGMSAVLAGAVHLTRRSLLVEGAVALLAAVIAAGLILDVISAGVAVAAFALVAVPYLVLLGRGRLHTSTAEARARDRTIAAIPDPQQDMWKVIGLIVLAVALIILGSEGMVRTALSLAGDWHLSHVVVGVLILAVLTSLPNALHGDSARDERSRDRAGQRDAELQHDQPRRRSDAAGTDRRARGRHRPGQVRPRLVHRDDDRHPRSCSPGRGGARRFDGALIIALYLAS